MNEELRFRSPNEAAGFTILPNLVLMSFQLSNPAKLLYALLRHFARQNGRCWPGQARLGIHLGLHERQIRNLLKELTEGRLITIERLDYNKTNRYWLEPLDQSALVPDRQSITGPDRQSSAGPMEEDTGEGDAG